MEDLEEQAKNLKIRQSDVAEALGLKRQAVNGWWPDPEAVPLKHRDKMEEMGFRFPGRKYAPETVTQPFRPTAPLLAEAQELVDQVVGELTTPEHKALYLALVNDVADLIQRLRAAGRDSEIRLTLQKTLLASRATSKEHP